jgi:hypothetical protein
VRRILRSAPSLLWLITIAPGWAAEPLVGHWLLTSQEIGGQNRENPDPLLLRITPNGKAFEFAYSVPINDIQFVAMKFAARLDGSGVDIKDAQGKTIGTAKVTKAGALQYKLDIQGPARPTASVTMTVSADGKTLTSTSDSMASGKNSASHTVQVFVRQ